MKGCIFKSQGGWYCIFPVICRVLFSLFFQCAICVEVCKCFLIASNSETHVKYYHVICFEYCKPCSFKSNLELTLTLPRDIVTCGQVSALCVCSLSLFLSLSLSDSLDCAESTSFICYWPLFLFESFFFVSFGAVTDVFEDRWHDYILVSTFFFVKQFF